MNASMHDVIHAKVVSYYIATVTSYIKLNASGIGDGSKVEIAINLNNYKTLYFFAPVIKFHPPGEKGWCFLCLARSLPSTVSMPSDTCYLLTHFNMHPFYSCSYFEPNNYPHADVYGYLQNCISPGSDEALR